MKAVVRFVVQDFIAVAFAVGDQSAVGMENFDGGPVEFFAFRT